MGKWVVVCFCGIYQGKGDCTERSRKKENREGGCHQELGDKRGGLGGVGCGVVVPQRCHQFLKLRHMEMEH